MRYWQGHKGPWTDSGDWNQGQNGAQTRPVLFWPCEACKMHSLRDLLLSTTEVGLWDCWGSEYVLPEVRTLGSSFMRFSWPSGRVSLHMQINLIGVFSQKLSLLVPNLSRWSHVRIWHMDGHYQEVLPWYLPSLFVCFPHLLGHMWGSSGHHFAVHSLNFMATSEAQWGIFPCESPPFLVTRGACQGSSLVRFCLLHKPSLRLICTWLSNIKFQSFSHIFSSLDIFLISLCCPFHSSVCVCFHSVSITLCIQHKEYIFMCYQDDRNGYITLQTRRDWVCVM